MFTACMLMSIILFASVDNTKSDRNPIEPDDIFFWDEEHDNWDILNGKDLYRFYSLGGEIFSFRAKQNGDLVLYEHHSKTESKKAGFSYVSKLENNDDDYFSPAYDPVAFEYKGVYHTLYYYEQRVGEVVVIDNTQQTIYHPKYYAKHFYTTGEDIYSWNNLGRITSENNLDKRKIYRGAVCIGDTLYMPYDSHFSPSELGDYDQLVYLDNKTFKIDVCTIDEENEINVVRTIELKNKMGRASHHPRAIDGFVHADGKVRLLISYSAETNTDKENKGGGVLLYSFASKSSLHLYEDYDFAYSVRCVQGSLKGKKSTSDVDLKKYPNRIQVLYNHFDNHTIEQWKDEGEFYYKTFGVDSENHEYILCDHGKIELGSDEEQPDEWNRMCMDVTTRITAANNNPAVKGTDSFSKDIWLFHTDNDGYIYGDIFESDEMRVVHNSLSYSDDLDNLEKYSEGVKKLWTLIGITDGPPPCAIDWEVWDSIYGGNNIDPTELSYSKSTDNEFKQTDSYSRSFYTETGVSIGMGDEKEGISGGVHSSFKFFNKIRRENTVTFSTEIEEKLFFALRDTTQSKGYEIWSIPNIHRVSFASYPWWDKDFSQQIEGSFCNMFYCTGNKLKTIAVPLKNMPYGIESVNDPSMASWYADNSLSRSLVVENAAKYNVPNVAIAYENSNGSEGSVIQSSGASNSFTQTHGFEIKVGGDVQYGVPKVFNISGSEEVGFNWEYEITTEHTTILSDAFMVSLNSLTTISRGILVDELDITTYFFSNNKDNEVDWWYYDYYDFGVDKKHVKPWYIAHVVTSSRAVEEVGVINGTYDLMTDLHQPFIYPTINSSKNFKLKNFDNPVKRVSVFSVTGKLIFQENTDCFTDEIIDLNLQGNFPKGTYLAKLVTDNGCITQKLIIQ